MRLLFAQEDSERRKAYLFAVANRLFEFCYGPETFAGFKPMLHNTPEYPIVRLLYSTMWHYLVGDGWKHWHNTCLDGLKKEVDSGKRVSYIAGGNDIYQLLKLGIYAIDVIDPMLPSQPEYYAEGWDWLIKKDGLGDEIMIDFPDKKLVMKRISYSEQGAFDAKLSTGITESLPLSKTTWHVFDRSNQKKLGSIVFDRRFCNQQDFIAHDKRALLISFNEMYFVAAPESLNGWGINLEKISPEMPIFIKQLRKPISRQVLLNLREAETSPFYFILLGSCPT
jgi:hypothetical protein